MTAKKKKSAIGKKKEKQPARAWLFWVLAATVLLFDRATKIYIAGNLALGSTVPVIDGYFQITFVRNPGGAFGFLPGVRWLFLAASIIVVCGIIIYKIRQGPQSLITDLSLGLILGGAAGNLIDRFLYGEVVDWLDFRIWPVFNLADSALVLGLAILAFELVRSDKESL